MGQEIEALSEPLSAAAPCGEDLEDSQLLASFDAYRIFGSVTPLPSDTAWREVRDRALEALNKSRDLRLLAHLAAAALRLDGLPAFCSVLTVADIWLAQRWDLTFPRVDEDAILRKNALNCFADRMAIVDALRRSPIAAQKQLGSVSLRDVELAAGQLTPTETDAAAPNAAQIEATLSGAPPEELEARFGQVRAALSALRNIVTTMQTQSGFESSPDFDPLIKPLSRIEQVLAAHQPGGAGVHQNGEAAAGAGGATAVVAVGEIKSRADAIRAIDAVAAFFQNNEPSSPVPLLLERAKRLVSKNFMEVLADIAPDSLTQVKLIGGIRDEG
ncbi:MAG TPA: type VI secretion system protein TssA [Steroidobacteraceae bacterium]|nr:type VI secretion system protein TssA [Steroidobacteraceae bacterium]